MSRENVELVRKSFRAYNAGGVEDLLPFVAADARWHAAAEWVEELVYRGHEGIRRLSEAWTENYDDWAWEIHDIRDLGARVLVLTEMSGQAKDSGVSIRQPVGIIYSNFREGKIGDLRYFLTWQEALGAAALSE